MADEEKKKDKEKETEEAQAEAETPVPKSGLMGKVLNGALVFVLCLGAVVAGGFINTLLHPPPAPPEYVLGKDNHLTVYIPPPPPEKKEEKEKKKKKEEKRDAPALFFSLEPLVVNFEESSAVRFLQIGMDIMARDPEVIAAVQKHVPLIRNNLLLLISNRDYQKLMTREGKEELRAQCLAEVKAILKKETGETGVENLLFTSFVVQ